MVHAREFVRMMLLSSLLQPVPDVSKVPTYLPWSPTKSSFTEQLSTRIYEAPFQVPFVPVFVPPVPVTCWCMCKCIVSTGSPVQAFPREVKRVRSHILASHTTADATLGLVYVETHELEMLKV